MPQGDTNQRPYGGTSENIMSTALAQRVIETTLAAESAHGDVLMTHEKERKESIEVDRYTQRWRDAQSGRVDEGPTWAAVRARAAQAIPTQNQAKAADREARRATDAWWDAVEEYCVKTGGEADAFRTQYLDAEGQDVYKRPYYPAGLVLEEVGVVMVTAHPQTVIVKVRPWAELDEAASCRVEECLIAVGLVEQSRAEKWSSAKTYLRLEQMLRTLNVEESQAGQDNGHTIAQVGIAQWHLMDCGEVV